ncbi:MAG: FFLEELY motif protein [Burkholderiaceae bacterium]
MLGRASARVEQEFGETLERVIRLRAELRANPDLGPRWLAVKAWQSRRFEATYADLLASERYGGPCRFFLEELYGVKDFERRDTEVKRVLPKLARMLPLRALETLLLAFQLDEMSERFDADMARIVAVPIGATGYAVAYPKVASMEDRQRQIDTVERIGQALDRLARVPMLSSLLTVMKGPAEAWGFGQLHHFLQHGFNAFAAMRGADEFLATIRRRESIINQRLFARDPDPFRAIEGGTRMNGESRARG